MFFRPRPAPITRWSVFGIKRRMKKVLVTGSSRGIGRAIAVDLAKAGYDPVVHCVKSLDEAREAAAELKSLGASGDVLFFDVSNREETAAALNGYVGENGAFYGVVLNAGIVADNSFPAMEGDEWDRVIRTDLDSFYNVLKPLVMPMVLRSWRDLRRCDSWHRSYRRHAGRSYDPRSRCRQSLWKPHGRSGCRLRPWPGPGPGCEAPRPE